MPIYGGKIFTEFKCEAVLLTMMTLLVMMNVLKLSSYDVDNLPNLADFIKPADKSSTFVQECITVQHAVGIRSKFEEQSLYYFAGLVAHKYLQHATLHVQSVDSC